MSNLAKYIREVADFPKPGIGFKDITTLLKQGEVFRTSVDELSAHFEEQGVDKIVGIESRGFIFGAVLAYKWNAGFVPVRKKGKLPAEIVTAEYELEYGTDRIEIHRDAIQRGERVLIVDDLLATGGTAAATGEVVRELGGEIVGFAFLIELRFLNGRSKLQGYPLVSLIQYESE